MALTWELRESDLEFFETELDDFIPERVFDAHAHLYKAHHWGYSHPTSRGPETVSLEEYQAQMQWLVPRREVHGLFFGVSFHEGFPEANEFVSGEVAKDDLSRGELLTPPYLDAERMRQDVKRLGFNGIKVYHQFIDSKPRFNADVFDFLVEDQIRVLHEEGWTVTLHMVKDRALADKRNQQQIRYYCDRYPGIKLILAHAARGFNPFHTIEGIRSLEGLENVWFDTSAVTEAGGFEAIIETFGHERLLWGSDYPISHLRGRCVAIGDQFLWLYEETLDWKVAGPGRAIQPLFVGFESLRALKLAAHRQHLTDSQIEDIFDCNARKLLEISS
jgi:glutamate-1-semialdehyde 2,1-aminomutase